MITRTGSGSITQEVFAPYTDLGATATDTEQGNLTSSIVTVNPVNTILLNTYTVRYNLSDAQGNMATQVTRSVSIIDTTKPVITIVGMTPLTVNKFAIYTDSGATANDNYDGNITASITHIGSVNTSTLGVYTIIYNVQDAHSNSATPVTRTVNVVDGHAPVITLV